jgi:hypothetical protein
LAVIRAFRLGTRCTPAVLLVLLACAAPARADWTFAAYLGAAHTLSSSLAVRQPPLATDAVFEPVSYRGESFRSPQYYGYRVGHTLPWLGHIAFEGEVIHLKVYAETDQDVRMTGSLNGIPLNRTAALSEVVQRFSLSHGVNLVLFNAVFRHPLGASIGSPPVVVAARVGAGFSFPHGESSIGGVAQQQYELGAFGLGAAVGAEIRITRHLHGVAEYKFTRSTQTVGVASGEATALLRTHHALFGLGFRL